MNDQQDDSLIEQRLMDLASSVPELYSSAQNWFLNQGPEIVTWLVKGLQDEQLGGICHWRILRLLGEFAEESTLPAILDALGKDDHVIRSGAIEALAAFPAREATEALIGVLESRDPDEVRHAAIRLGQKRDVRAREALIRLLGSPDPSFRHSAANALIALRDPSANAALRNHLAGETNQEVRELIESALL